MRLFKRWFDHLKFWLFTSLKVGLIIDACLVFWVVNPFHTTGHFLYTLETSENLRFFVFIMYRQRPVAWYRLVSWNYSLQIAITKFIKWNDIYKQDECQQFTLKFRIVKDLCWFHCNHHCGSVLYDIFKLLPNGRIHLLNVK